MYVATIGYFDGVHLGHQFVLSQLKEVARQHGLQSAVLTFAEHPQTVLTGKPKPLLTTYQERVAMLRSQQVDQIFAFNFDIIRGMTAEQFMSVLKNQCGVELLLMGYDHHFGSDQPQTFADYQQIADRVGLHIALLDAFQVTTMVMELGDTQVHPVQDTVSSTMIRDLLLVGEIEEANDKLGYAYTLAGPVVRGRQIGRTLGFPTANIAVPYEKLIPRPGVYVADVQIADEPGVPQHRALVNVGSNPTVADGQQVTVEAHLIDYEGDLYDHVCYAHLLSFMRPEKRFDSLDELRIQIEKDKAAINP